MFEEIKNDFLCESIYKGKLSNGLKLIFVRKRGFSTQFAMYMTNYGSNNISFIPIGEDKPVTVPLGIAHFLEHKMFDNEGGVDVMDEFAAKGASPNAYTNCNCTAYHFESTDCFYDNLRTLINYVNSPYFTEESVEKEKPIIAEELSMYDDDPDSVLINNFLKSIYHVHPVKNNIGGDAENVYRITKDMLYLCYNNFYAPENMVLAISGDLDPDEVFEKAEEFIKEDKRNLPKGNVINVQYDEPETVVSEYVEKKMDVSRPKVLYGYKGKAPNINGKELLKKYISSSMAFELFAGQSSNLYNTLYNEQIIDDSFSFDIEIRSDYAFGFFSAETDRYEEMIAVLKDELKKQKATHFDKIAFDRLKKCYVGAFIKSLNSVKSVVSASARHYLENCDIFDYYDIIRNIEVTDIDEAFAEFFVDGATSVSLILPNE